jgi:hypothetical protein
LKGSESLLARNPQRTSSLDVKGLALCGLALCDRITHVAEAKEAFASARKIGVLSGSVRQLLRQFDALAAADKLGVLQDVRPMAAGTTGQNRAV